MKIGDLCPECLAPPALRVPLLAHSQSVPKSEQDALDNYSAFPSRIWGGQGGAGSAMPAGIVSVG
jgi:hypothetical protein